MESGSGFSISYLAVRDDAMNVAMSVLIKKH